MLKPILLSLLTTLPLCADQIPVYLGTRTDKGIFHVELNSETGELTKLKNAVKTGFPASLAISNDRKYIYAVGKTKGEKIGYVASFSRNDDGSLKEISKESSKGELPCHISLDSGSKNLFTANYGGGSVSSFSLSNAGKPGGVSPVVSFHQHVGSSIDPKRQKAPHAHSIYPSPDDKHVYAADLGTDDVFIYSLDVATGKMTAAGSGKVPAGGGPRHMDFSQSGDKLYVLNEMKMTISQFARNADSGGLTLEKTMPVMAEFQKKMSCSEIQVSADGKFIYAACRDLDNKGRDVISVLKADDLSIIQEQPSGVWIPRHFGISPSGKWFLIAGQSANRVIVHARDPKTGLLEVTEHSIELERPMWVLFP